MLRSIAVSVLLFVSFTSFSQDVTYPTKLFSSDKNFSLETTAAYAGEHRTKWTRILLDEQSNNPVLIIIDTTSDAPPPVSYWNKSSSKLIYDFEKDGNGEIKIFDLNIKKEVYSATGDIWSNEENHFDSVRNLLFFFRDIPETNFYELLSLDVETLYERVITKIAVWKDPLDSPSIEGSDFAKKEIIIQYMLPDWSKSIKLLVKY